MTRAAGVDAVAAQAAPARRSSAWLTAHGLGRRRRGRWRSRSSATVVRDQAKGPFMGAAGPSSDFRRRRNAAGDLRQSAAPAVGRHRGPHRRLRPQSRAKDRAERPSSWCWPSTVPTWAARSRGFRSRACSCAPATAASITPTASAPRGRRRAGCFIASGGCSDGQLEIQAPHYPTLQDTLGSDTTAVDGMRSRRNRSER